jgi:hypothetical protein
MSEQAIETEEETLDPSLGRFEDDDVEQEIAALEEVIETEQPGAEPEEAEQETGEDEVELILEDEEEPTSKPLRKGGFYKRLSKVAGQRDAAKEEADELRHKLEMKEEEARLWRIKAGQSDGIPKEDDFESFEDFEKAKQRYDKDRENERIAQLAEEKARSVLQEMQAQSTQVAQSQEFEAKFEAAVEQAEKLKIKDFDEAGEQLVESIGQPLVEYILNNHGQSAAMIYKLYKNPSKARHFHELSLDPARNGVRLAQELTRFEDGIQFKPKHSPPADPETTIEKGVSARDAEFLKGARFE